MTDKKNYQEGKRDQNDSSVQDRTDKVGSGRSIGRGMDSPDSTEAVLDASTGEPDPRARGEGALPPGTQPGKQSAQSNSGATNNQANTKTNNKQ